jgi:signal transduction histidine kinase
VNLAVEQNLFYLQIEDDGKGIEEKNLHDPKSIGILGMKERALPFGGVVTVSRAGQKGTRVNLQFPLKSHD